MFVVVLAGKVIVLATVFKLDRVAKVLAPVIVYVVIPVGAPVAPNCKVP